MKEAFFSDNFCFINHSFTKYHYTDNRRGSPMNYLAYMLNGRCRIATASKIITVNEGDVFYIPKNLGYESYWYGEEKINFLSFGFLYLNTCDNRRFELQTIPCEDTLKKKIISIPTVYREITCSVLSRFYEAMSELMPLMEYETASKNELIVEKAKKYISHNLSCSMPEAARACLISEPYLYALFKNVTGDTPNAFRQKLLCKKGVELLTTTDKTIDEISDILNFSSSSYFRKILKRHTGKTPREIRKNSVF